MPLLTAAMYAAIQAHESTLPLPSYGNPQPMFGMINGAGGVYAVGTGQFTSGGTGAASNSLGLPAGYTSQDLFPSIINGVKAFDSLINRNDPSAAQYVISTGDFCGFMAKIAPWYAGPGEAPGFSTQCCAYYQEGVGDIGAFSAALSGETPTTNEPGVSLASDIAAAPQPDVAPSLIAPGAQPVVTPPTPQVTYATPFAPQRNDYNLTGWDAVKALYETYIPQYTKYDGYLVDLLNKLPGSVS